MMRFAVTIAALGLLGACGSPAAAPPTPERGASYALSLPVTPAPGGPVQRFTLPAAAVAALRRADAGEVRLFDGSGRVISLARSTAGAASAQRETRTVPAARTASSTISPGQSTVTLKVEQAGQAVIVDATDPAGPAGRKLETLLLDTRALTDPAVELVLDAALPEHLDLSVMVDQSRDLATWRPAATKVLFRFDPSAPDPAVNRIKLAGKSLNGTYLRVSWAAAPGVVIKGVQVVTVKQLPDPDLALPASGASLIDPHTLNFSVPLALAPSGLRLTGAAATGVVPVRLEARRDANSPWRALSAAPLRGAEPAVLACSSERFAQYRVTADARSAGFGAPPSVELLVAPVHLLAAFNGQPPYRLAVGNPAAEPAYFAPAELLGDKSDAELPHATIGTAALMPGLSLAPAPGESRFPARTIALWATLLAATAVLGIAAFGLMRGSAAPDPAAADPAAADSTPPVD